MGGAGAGGDVRLTQCPRCKRFADKYVEHDFVVLFIDLVLVKPQVSFFFFSFFFFYYWKLFFFVPFSWRPRSAFPFLSFLVLLGRGEMGGR